ncbi:hypothetical protein NIBR502774_06075 [Rhizobium sp. NIBRBAC000502774]|jgi:hypothetical protein|uniref:hypothetical protein n=1 Tax=Rhizobium/Agrobacterium group TaxID=227290 RepID=UPI00080FEC39|nr:hypothetical protein [Rhizobium sp. SJZ105]NTC81960.1 hypothetical protein [Agrobacterium tumefaciens]QDG92118.1 hypothetical protein NIBR502774_06075 [Rhizobium sp. NIBRBAC000502774]NTD09118.1 hypothetical protein [Agrobacterium tumefaciens]OCJ68673.1 hypothetical protein A6U97_08515 [Agrobacterium tumefaciens]QTQ82620.1 hypothetical protein J8N08_00225 [Agrobacterium tumefaciens]
MPTASEVRLYLKGLWLLLLGDHTGARYLDLSERGMWRSFYSALWCLPAMLVSWLWLRNAFLASCPPGTKTGLIYFFRLAMVEAICWIVPLLLIGMLLFAFGAREKFAPLVTTMNWLSLPFSYAYAVLILIAFFLPPLQGLIAILWLALLLSLVFAFSRIVRFFIRDQSLLVSAIVMTLLVPGMLLSEALQRFLGVYPA